MRKSQDLFKDQEFFLTRSDRRSFPNVTRLTPHPSSSGSARLRSCTRSVTGKSKKEDPCLGDIIVFSNTYPQSRITPQTPINREHDQILVPFGIYESIQRRIENDLTISASSNKFAANIQEDSKKTKWRNFGYMTALLLMMFLSGFFGAYCFVLLEPYYSVGRFSSQPNSGPGLQTDVDLVTNNRPSNKDLIIHQLTSSIIQLEEKMSAMEEKISDYKDTSSDVITKPKRGLLEELLGSELDLASAGNLGQVLATPDTSDFKLPVQVPLLGLFSFTLDLAHRPPDTTIKGLIQEVGDCWAFCGRRGRLVLSLFRPSHVTGVSISHIPATISPSGDIATAPRHFLLLVRPHTVGYSNTCTHFFLSYKPIRQQMIWKMGCWLENLSTIKRGPGDSRSNSTR